MVRIALFAALSASAAATVSVRTLRELETSSTVDVLVHFDGESGLSKLDTESLPREDRAQAVLSTLQAESAIVTADAVELAKAAGVEYTAYWIAQYVYVKGASKELVNQLAALRNVVSVAPVEVYKLPELVEVPADL
ncbi:hypothetical protein AaE_003301, partial [Aphanomyces astaci]